MRISRAKFQDYNEMIPSQKSETTYMLPLLSKIICYFSWLILGLGKRKKYQIKLNILSLRIMRKCFKQYLIINWWLSLCLHLMYSLICGCPNICWPTNIHILVTTLQTYYVCHHTDFLSTELTKSMAYLGCKKPVIFVSEFC